MSAEVKLEQLFIACGSRDGYIRPEDLRELCSGFNISAAESDIIFQDLDKDEDGKIDFSDFCQGFQEFIDPSNSEDILTEKEFAEAYSSNPEEFNPAALRRQSTQFAWSHFANNAGITEKYSSRAGPEKMYNLPTDAPSVLKGNLLGNNLESVLTELMSDVQRLQEENKKLEKTYKRERQEHGRHLRSLEEELDIQVAKAQSEARQKAKEEAEIERRNMQSQLKELQSHLQVFQKVGTWLQSRKTEDEEAIRAREQLENASEENKKLRNNLSDTQTSIALMRSELAQLRDQYEDKCKELHNERQSLHEFMHEESRAGKQVSLLQEANRKLQDVNDSLRDVGISEKKPRKRLSRHSSRAGSTQGRRRNSRRRRSEDSVTDDVSGSSGEGSPYNSYLTPIHGGSHLLPQHEDVIKRFMEDLDSGHSTLREGQDGPPSLTFSDRSLQGELAGSDHPSLNTADLETEASGSTAPFEIQPEPDYHIPKPKIQPYRATLHPGRISPLRANVIVPPPTLSEGLREMDFEPTGPPERTYKVVFAGDAAVGKSSFIIRICKGIFERDISSTLGVDFRVKCMRIDGKNTALQLWDTAGQERFRSITKSYFRRADGVMLLYDVTSERSFLSVRQWIQDIDEATEKRTPIILCGNKTDLRDGRARMGELVVTKKQGEKLAKECGAIFLETSNKSGSNVFDAIVQLSREMAKNEAMEVQTSSIVKIDSEAPKNKSCCSGAKKKDATN